MEKPQFVFCKHNQIANMIMNYMRQNSPHPFLLPDADVDYAKPVTTPNKTNTNYTGKRRMSIEEARQIIKADQKRFKQKFNEAVIDVGNFSELSKTREGNLLKQLHQKRHSYLFFENI